MSEYQSYEFHAVDRPLTDREMSTLRGASSRATITPSGFANSYSYGSFKGNERQWMERYFDAFVYVANWGTRRWMVRLPRQVLDLETARRYLGGHSAAVRASGDFLILDFLSEEEGGEWVEDEEGSGWMSALLPARAALASGDLRLLYLGWLLTAQTGELDGDAPEPTVPAGLGALDASLGAFAELVRLDDDLLRVAAERSAPLATDARSREDLVRWIQGLPESEKTDLLVRLAADDAPRLRAEVLRRFRASQPEASTTPASPRTVSELLAAAESRTRQRLEEAAERAARERVRREREVAAERERYLDGLAKRERSVWTTVESLLSTRKPSEYPSVVTHLRDLRDLATRSAQAEDFEGRLRELRKRHAGKATFLRSLDAAGLTSRSQAR